MFNFLKKSNSERVQAYLRVSALEYDPKVSKRLSKIAQNILDRHKVAQNTELEFFMMVGFGKSGKHTLIQKYDFLRDLLVISTEEIHAILGREFFFHLSKLRKERWYWEKYYLAQIIRNNIINIALQQKISTLSECKNLKADGRAELLGRFKSQGFTTHIVHVKCPEHLLLERLRRSDESDIKKGIAPSWMETYQKEKAIFEPPHEAEADYYLVHDAKEDGFE